MTRFSQLADRVLHTAFGRQLAMINALEDATAELGAVVRQRNLPPGVAGSADPGIGGPTMIYVDPRMAVARQRFTLAHELGHLVLNRSTVITEHGDQLPTTQNAIERLCDAIGGALLIPTEWIRARLLEVPDLPTLLALSSDLQVSPSALTIRLSESDRPCVLMSARRGADGWEWAWSAGEIPSLADRDMRRDIPASGLADLARSGSWTWSPLGLHDGLSSERFAVDVVIGDDIANLLLRPLAFNQVSSSFPAGHVRSGVHPATFRSLAAAGGLVGGTTSGTKGVRSAREATAWDELVPCDAGTRTLTQMRVVVEPGNGVSHRWLVVAPNGARIAEAAEAFGSRQNAARAAWSFANGAAQLDYDVAQDQNGRWRWRARRRSTLVAVSCEAYAKRSHAFAAADSMQRLVRDTAIQFTAEDA